MPRTDTAASRASDGEHAAHHLPAIFTSRPGVSVRRMVSMPESVCAANLATKRNLVDIS